MPDEYTKLAEGIVKGNVPWSPAFVERYVSDRRAGLFRGRPEHVDGDIRVHVTLSRTGPTRFAHARAKPASGIVDLQQLPDTACGWWWGGSLSLLETQA